VIGAGSVLTFLFRNGIREQHNGCGIVGQWRESGLGRVWVAPEMLAGEPGDRPSPEADPPSFKEEVSPIGGSTEHLSAASVSQDPLVVWTKRTAERRKAMRDLPTTAARAQALVTAATENLR